MTLSEGEPMYFSYDAVNSGDTMVISARADFKPGGPVHTVTQTLTLDRSSGCEVVEQPVLTLNAFE